MDGQRMLWQVVIGVAAGLGLGSDLRAAEIPLELSGTPSFVSTPACPLAGRLSFRVSRPCRAEVEVRQAGRRWMLAHHDRVEEQHEVAVLGLRAGLTHELLISLSAADKTIAGAPVKVTPPPLPADFPTVRVTHADPVRMEPGVTMFNPLRWDDDQSAKDFGLFLATDAAGEVVWSYQLSAPSGAIRLSNRGNLMFLFGTWPVGLREISVTGETVCEWKATGLDPEVPEGAVAVPVDTFHHDFWELPNGNLLVLSSELRRLKSFPADESSPNRGFMAANVVGDVIVEFARDGSIVQRWPLLDILDPRRISYDSHDTFWDRRGYGDVPGGTKDWSHANALVYDERDDSFVLSLRHQDAIVKIDRRSSQVKWILGARRGWRGELGRRVLRPGGFVEWPYHTHAPEFTPQGTLLVFDNGNHRTVPPGKKMPPTAAYSRAVEFEIDEANGTATQVWAYGGPGPDRFYAPFLGDANWLPATGHVLITIGGRIVDEAGEPVDHPPGAAQWARVVEVTRDDPAEVVFELILDDRETRPSLGWSIFRAQRIADLIPLPEES